MDAAGVATVAGRLMLSAGVFQLNAGFDQPGPGGEAAKGGDHFDTAFAGARTGPSMVFSVASHAVRSRRWTLRKRDERQ